MKISIITGASSGLGIEFLKTMATKDNLDEIWIIARRLEKLEELKNSVSSKTKIKPIKLDLTKEEALVELTNLLNETKPEIVSLINNAGVGKLGNMIDEEYHVQANMVNLNCTALTAVTTICLPYMKKKEGKEKVSSYILNVCSIASFAPNPKMTVYCSTKAYVLSFTKSLKEELKGTGINCLAVCPGPMDTEFLTVADIKGKSKTFDTLPYCDPTKVAPKAVTSAEKGKTIYTPRFFFKFYRVLAKILPHNFVMKLSKT